MKTLQERLENTQTEEDRKSAYLAWLMTATDLNEEEQAFYFISRNLPNFSTSILLLIEDMIRTKLDQRRETREGTTWGR